MFFMFISARGVMPILRRTRIEVRITILEKGKGQQEQKNHTVDNKTIVNESLLRGSSTNYSTTTSHGQHVLTATYNFSFRACPL